MKKKLQNLVLLGRKAVSKCALPEIPFERTVSNEIASKTHLEWENYGFKQIFEIFIKFPIQ